MANFITIFRIFLVFVVVYLLTTGGALQYFWAFGLTILVFILDGVDGWVARKFNESSKFGAVLDIIGDRVVENTLWTVFAVLGWLPIAFPIIALTRSFVVDGFRSVAMEQGFTAFGSSSMQNDKFGNFICSSNFSRATYAVAKVFAFICMILGSTPRFFFRGKETILTIGLIASFIAIEFCVIRALPVIFESKRFFAKVTEQNGKDEKV